MDPDLVRQQQEAEREARQKIKAPPSAVATNRVLEAVSPAPSGRAGLAVLPATGAAADSAKAADQAAPVRWKRGGGPLSRLGRLFSFAAAGAILGAAAGIVIVESFKLLPDQTQLAVFGGAGVMALVCALAGLRQGHR